MNQRKILVALSDLSAGGAERVATTLCNSWSAKGYLVTLVVTFSGATEPFYPLSPEVETIFLAHRVKSQRKSLWNQFERLRALRWVIQEKQADVVISFLTNVNVAAIFATRGLAVPVIACERNDPTHQSIPSGLACQRRMLYPFAEMITVQTEAAAPVMRSICPSARNIQVIPNPLPSGIPDAAPSREPETKNEYRLIAMGRFVEQKNFCMLIEEFANLADENTNWQLIVYGEGPLRPQLEERIVRLQMDDRIHLPGRTATPWQVMQEADAFVLSSRYEGFPNVLMEAMALGLPCVAVDCPHGPRDLSRDGQDALLVPLNDSRAFQEALRRIMSDPTLRTELGRQAQKSIHHRYNLEKILQKWEGLFQVLSI